MSKDANYKMPLWKRAFRILLLVVLFLGAVTILTQFQWAVSPSGSLDLSPPIPYKVLTSERDTPFLISGKSPPRGSKFDGYRSAIKKWPDVRSCLVKSERTKVTPDLRLIDWGQLYTSEDADVCVFRIFSSIGSISGAVAWLKFHEFEVGGSPILGAKIMYNGKYQNKKIISASISVNRNSKIKFPTYGLKRIWINLMAYGQGISSSWLNDGILVGVHNSYTFL